MPLASSLFVQHGGNLRARHVIHTVGPVYQRDKHLEMEHTLACCYTNSLHLAAAHGCVSIAFPNIGTGVYGFPKEAAARVATRAVEGFIKDRRGFRKICYVCFDGENYEIYARLLK